MICPVRLWIYSVSSRSFSFVRNCRVFCGVTRSLFDVVFPETFMSTITFGSSIAVWFMKTSVIIDCTV